jgi:AcrR family transcriptional regulator
MPRPKKSPQEIAEMQDRIVDAAITLLQEEGMAGVSIRAIAERLGLSHMVFYTYFESRAQLFAALKRRQREMMESKFGEVLAQAQEGDPQEVLLGLLAHFQAFADNYPRIYRLLYVHPETAPELLAGQQEQLTCQREQISRLIQMNIERGHFVERDPDLAAMTVFCMINAPLILHHNGRIRDPELRDRVTAEMLQAVIDYLCGSDQKGSES